MGSSVIHDESCAGAHTWIPKAQRGMGGARPHPDNTASLQDYELWKSSDKICRQLIYHLTPHSKRQRGSSLLQRKTQSW